MAEVRIQICGRLAVTVDGERIEHRFPSRQGRVLFCFLAAHRAREVPRALLIEALWPADRPASADAALRALLSKLRQALGSDLLSTGSHPGLSLPPGAFVDLEAAAEAIHRAESAVARGEFAAGWAPARIALHTAERGFLPDVDLPWADDVRRRLSEMQLDALEAIAAIGAGMGGAEHGATERAARRLVELEPLRESGWMWLMRAHAARGNPSKALLAYEEVRLRLRDELGVAPGPELQALHAELLGS